MPRLAIALSLLVVLIFFTAPREALTFSSGAPANRSGAPGENTCATAGCHSSFDLNSGTGSVSIDAPETYLPGEAVDLLVAVDNTTPPVGESVNGFQVSVKDDTGEDVGSFEIVDPLLTRFASGSDAHVTHTGTGSMQAEWEVRWIAPDPAPTSVTVYAAGNAANGDRGSGGDFIYTTSVSLTLSGVANEDDLPDAVALDAVWPNPIADRATFAFTLADAADVVVSVVDGLGREVVEAHRGWLGAGAQTIDLDASRLAAGVYFATVATPEGRRVLPITVAR